VIVARPATAPVSRPTKCGFFAYHHSTNSHVVAANDAAMSVLRKAVVVIVDLELAAGVEDRALRFALEGGDHGMKSLGTCLTD
jgi:hypothetical protein